MKNKLYSICVTILALVLLLSANFDRAREGIQRASAAGGVGYVTVPAAAFTPLDETVTYYQGGSELYLTIPTAGGWFSAPVYLPHGATLSKLTYYWFDDYDAEDTECRLKATDTSSTTYSDVYISYPVSSQGTGGYDSTETTTFYIPTVDNSKYLYYMDCLLYRLNTSPYFVTKLFGMRIEYSYPVYLPLTTK